MKKLLKFSAIALLFPVLAFNSCSDDDNNTVLNTPAPSKGLVTPGSGELTVSWTPPQIPMNNPLKNYEITWTPGDGSATVATGINSYKATNLTSGTKYTFVIKAIYASGPSTPLVLQGTPVKGEALAAVAAVGADTVLFDAETKTYEMYFNKQVDLTQVAVGMSLNEGSSLDGATGTASKVMDLSAGEQQLTFKVNSEDQVYTFKATTELLLTDVASMAYGSNAKVTLDQAAQTIAVDYGAAPVDKSKLNLSLTVAQGATLVAPATPTAIVDASAGTYKVTLNNKYGHQVIYTITSVKGSVAPFEPKSITGKDVPSTWSRIYVYNDVAIPQNVAVYNVNKETSTYVVLWTKGSKFTVVADGTAKKFSDIATAEASKNAVLFTGNYSTKTTFHNGTAVISGDQAAAFGYDASNTWTQNTGQFNGTTYVNVDKGEAAWNAVELFSGGGFYLNPGAGGGYTPAGDTKAFQCFFGCNQADNGSLAGFFLAANSNYTQDNVCEAFISMGITCGYPMGSPNSSKTAVGLTLNGKTVIASDMAVYTAIAVN